MNAHSECHIFPFFSGETLAFSDILGANTSSPTTKSGQTFLNTLTNSSNGGSTNSSGYYSSSLNGTSGGGSQTLAQSTGTTMTPNGYQMQSAKSFDNFQVSILEHIGHIGSKQPCSLLLPMAIENLTKRKCRIGWMFSTFLTQTG
jgi:hypothetical protein